MVFSGIVRWMRLRYYQYSVAMPLVMLTPAETAVFNTCVLLLLAMVLTAIVMYMPEHISTMTRRAAFYLLGNDSSETSDL